MTSEDAPVPLRRRVVLGFSCSRGARFPRARAERAFLGFLLGTLGRRISLREYGPAYISLSIMVADMPEEVEEWNPKISARVPTHLHNRLHFTCQVD